MLTLALPLPADAGAGGHIEDAARHIERGGERAAVDVRHRDADDRQDGVLGDGLRARHGVDRGVVQGGDGDLRRLRGGTVILAVVQTPPQRARRIGAEVRRILAGRPEADRLHERLIIRERGRAIEQKALQAGIVKKVDLTAGRAGEGPALQAVDGQNVAIKPAGNDSNSARDQVGVVDVARGRGRRDRHRRAVLGVRGGCGNRLLRRVVHGDDIDRRRCGGHGLAVGHGPRQGSLRAVAEVGGIVAARLELNLLQQRLIVRDRTRAAEDQRMLRRHPDERNAVHGVAGDAADTEDIAVTGKRAAGDAHERPVELGIIDIR